MKSEVTKPAIMKLCTRCDRIYTAEYEPDRCVGCNGELRRQDARKVMGRFIGRPMGSDGTNEEARTYKRRRQNEIIELQRERAAERMKRERKRLR